MLILLAGSAGFLVYEFQKASKAFMGSGGLVNANSYPFSAIPRKNLYDGMIETEEKYKLSTIENNISNIEKRLDKQEKVISKLIEELGG